MSDDQIAAEAEKKDRMEWGRTWVWEGYYNPKEKDTWIQTVEALKHVNKHVCQDIEDFIMLKGLKTDKLKGDRLRDFIEADQKERIAYEKAVRGD